MKKSVIVAGGLDPSGGAGLASDIKVCSFFNVYPLPVLTALTYQNSKEFYGFEAVKTHQVENQLNSILSYYNIEVAKIGLTGNFNTLQLLIDRLSEKGIKIILDPVLKTSTEGVVSDNFLIETILKNAERIFLITPNIPEAITLSGVNSRNIKSLGNALLNSGFKRILIKGGHLDVPIDMLITVDECTEFKGTKIETKNTRGTGCALSSAIASNLSLGFDLKQAISISKNYLAETMQHSYKLGEPPYPLNLLLK